MSPPTAGRRDRQQLRAAVGQLGYFGTPVDPDEDEDEDEDQSKSSDAEGSVSIEDDEEAF